MRFPALLANRSLSGARCCRTSARSDGRHMPSTQRAPPTRSRGPLSSSVNERHRQLYWQLMVREDDGPILPIDNVTRDR